MRHHSNQPGKFRELLHQIAPGLEALSRYDRSWLAHDVGAGLSVAAIALPIGNKPPITLTNHNGATSPPM